MTEHAAAAPPGGAAREGRVAALRTRAMFWAAFAWLVLLASLLPHTVFDLEADPLPPGWQVIVGAIAALWLVVLAEGMAGFLAAPDRPRPALDRLALVALVPALRMTLSPARPAGRVWLPGLGWIARGSASERDLERRAAVPMLVITALILPVLAGEFLFAEAVQSSPALLRAMRIVTAVIWLAFAVEFIVMISLAEKRLAFVRRHWINLVIILLPLFAFLRGLVALRFLRMARAGRMIRLYRLRGLMHRAMRIALAFKLVERVMMLRPEVYAARLQERIDDREAELAEMRAKLEAVRAEIAESETATPPPEGDAARG